MLLILVADLLSGFVEVNHWKKTAVRTKSCEMANVEGSLVLYNSHVGDSNRIRERIKGNMRNRT